MNDAARPAQPAADAAAGADARAQFRWYAAGVASWFASVGIQAVLFPYLVAVKLGMPAEYVGIAQMALTAPSVVFMLWGGAIADRSDVRRLVARNHMLAAIPPLGLGGVLFAGALSYEAILLFAVMMGTLSALTIPARDAMLTRVIGPGMSLQTAVSTAVIAQFGAQLVGMAATGAASTVGPEIFCLLQSVIIGAGALATLRLKPHPPEPHEGDVPAPLAAILEGLRAVAASRVILPVCIAMLAIGLLYVGAFMVVIPLIIRDVFAGSSGGLALANVAFWGGTIIATALLMRLKPVAARGKAMTTAMCIGAAILAAMSLDLPFWGFCLACFLWGLGAGVTINMGRTIVQEEAPARLRARILAAYNAGFMAGAPLGALFMGFVVAALGPQTATLVPAGLMALVLAVLAATTHILAIRAPGAARGD